jgi:hypothetical protein
MRDIYIEGSVAALSARAKRFCCRRTALRLCGNVSVDLNLADCSLHTQPA